MSVPEIDIRFGGGTWRRSDKRYLAPIVSCAVDIAKDGINYYGIHTEQPKVAKVYLCGRNYPSAGESTGATEFELNFRAVDVKRKKIFNNELRRKHSVGTVFHELLHSVRSEYFEHDAIEELIATEGISYVGAELLLDELGLGRKFASIPTPQNSMKYALTKEVLTAELLADIDVLGSDTDHLVTTWIELNPNGTMPPGVFLGCLAVSDLLASGAGLKDVVQMDAREILSI